MERFGAKEKVPSIAKPLKKNGRHEETRTPDLYRVKIARTDFTATYKTAGTAKVRGSRTSHHFLWVEVVGWRSGRILQCASSMHFLMNCSCCAKL